MNPNNTEINNMTKEAIAIAAKEIIVKNDSFTVSNICKRAGVSRNAFYRNFDDVDSILIYYLVLQWANYSKENAVENSPQEDRINHLIHFFYSEKDFVTALKRKNMTYIVEKLFVTVIVPQKTEGARRYYLYAISYLIYGVIRAMIDDDFAQTPDQIIAMTKAFKDQNTNH